MYFLKHLEQELSLFECYYLILYYLGSPFNVAVKNEVNPNKVKCFGPGLDKAKGVPAGHPATFTVDTSEAGEAPLEVSYVDTQGRSKFIPMYLSVRFNI